ncbi:antirepressor regulating drug resistance protein [Bradyrhizobium sp. CCBAU 53351]|uniref:M56 family metallopeptidase n=1 Tax=Bradyrhizobium sp. CCBAU 53351 TaxID=1325114 RepID=UPI00188928EC|nr:M56 family metallopeptidase [Bradyrhizobium sp. CCBAU 53351]QOZ78893.1 antirepressor regulating drug resistance protein [Bradyrhizobium sp. CCBAU 53351]
MIATLAEAALRSLVLGGVVWFGLNLFCARNPRVHMTAWIVVLLASLAMPFVMHWPTLTISRLPLPVSVPDDFLPADISMLETPQPALSGAPAGAVAPPVMRSGLPINWWLIATLVYAGVAGLLLLRLAIGLFLTWRLARAAKPLRGLPMTGTDVRVSRDVGGPVTFGSTILVPPQFAGWDAKKRLAVLAHEGAHVANRDFYVLLLASLNRAMFWFSPFAWWQLARLAELAEIISDIEAIEVIEDRLSYAEILLDFASTVRPRSVELAMARASTVRARVERIIAAAAMPAAVGWRKRLWIASAIAPVVIMSAGMIAYRAPDPAPIADLGEAPAQHYRPFVNFYAMGPASVFAIFREGDDLYGQMTGQRKLRLTVGRDGTASYPASSGEITFPLDAEHRSAELSLRMNGRDIRAVRVAEMPTTAAEPAPLDQYVGWYRLAPNRVLTVRRDGDRLQVQETVQGPATALAEGADAFSIHGHNLLIFLRDEQARVSRVLVQNAVAGARLAPRIDAAVAQAIEADFARRVAEVPDRFREQVPVAGSKEMILRGIEDMRQGRPNYDRMSAPLAAKIHRQLNETQATFVALGALESIFFRGVGPGGYDIYGAKFENGTAEFRLLLEPDGKAGDVIFRADGNDELGGIMPCAEQANVRGRAGTSPIRIMLYNEMGEDIRIFNLDADGNRKAQSVVRPNMSWAVTTTVNNPWVIADKSGRCLEVLMPGRQTRFHNVEASNLGAKPGRAARRAVPIANGEEMLRRYIEGVGKGQPDYELMTSEVAEITRQQLPFDQAILAKLGALRAVSFRGVTALDSDIYIAQFANGSAEWRIGVRNGTITKIALGPNF